jgi:hypothetical protein
MFENIKIPQTILYTKDGTTITLKTRMYGNIPETVKDHIFVYENKLGTREYVFKPYFILESNLIGIDIIAALLRQVQESELRWINRDSFRLLIELASEYVRSYDAFTATNVHRNMGDK